VYYTLVKFHIDATPDRIYEVTRSKRRFDLYCAHEMGHRDELFELTSQVLLTNCKQPKAAAIEYECHVLK